MRVELRCGLLYPEVSRRRGTHQRSPRPRCSPAWDTLRDHQSASDSAFTWTSFPVLGHLAPRGEETQYQRYILRVWQVAWQRVTKVVPFVGITPGALSRDDLLRNVVRAWHADAQGNPEPRSRVTSDTTRLHRPLRDSAQATLRGAGRRSSKDPSRRRRRRRRRVSRGRGRARWDVRCTGWSGCGP